jgi:predicted RNA-binding protein with PUA-like domain
MQYWLFKSEPSAYSIDDLARDSKTHWDGVRNFQARNYLRDQMRIGDKVLFYHSNTDPLAIVGVAEISCDPYPDHTAFDPNDSHYDPKSKLATPTWYMVDITFTRKLNKPITLPEIKADPILQHMVVAQKGSRLSVQPVLEEHFKRVELLGS